MKNLILLLCVFLSSCLGSVHLVQYSERAEANREDVFCKGGMSELEFKSSEDKTVEICLPELDSSGIVCAGHSSIIEVKGGKFLWFRRGTKVNLMEGEYFIKVNGDSIVGEMYGCHNMKIDLD